MFHSSPLTVLVKRYVGEILGKVLTNLNHLCTLALTDTKACEEIYSDPDFYLKANISKYLDHTTKLNKCRFVYNQSYKKSVSCFTNEDLNKDTHLLECSTTAT